jgi:hypothetical protein
VSTDKTTHKMLSAGKFWAQLGQVIGASLSVAANVAHSFVPPAGAADNWTPQIGSVISSFFWPVLLFIVIEAFVHVVWPTGLAWKLIRYGGMLPVATISAIVSYRHMSSLLTTYGEDKLVSTLGPLAIDGAMVVFTAALLAIGKNTRPALLNATVPATEPAQPTYPTPAPATEPAYPATPAPAQPVTPAVTTHDDIPAAAPTVTTAQPAAVPAAVEEPATPPAGLVSMARMAQTNWSSTSGGPIPANVLAARLNISTDTADQLVQHLRASQPANTARVNGTPVTVGA